MRKVQVTIWNKPVEVSVCQKSKLVWIASGEYLDKVFTFRGRSESVAAKAWAEAAQDHLKRNLGARLVIRQTKT